MKTNNKIYVTTYVLFLSQADFNIDLLMFELADRCLATMPTPEQIYIIAQSDVLASADIHNLILKYSKNIDAPYQLINIGTFGPFKK
mgnify:CR=1 FL=1